MEENRRNPFAWFFVAGGTLIVLAIVLWLVFNRPGTSQATPPTVTPASVAQVQRVTLQEAKAAYDNGSALFLDVRDSTSYAASHINGAVSIPQNELLSRLNELDPSVWIIPY